MKWLEQFDERQQKEIEFSILYLNQFEHGTDGHNAKVIIAKMAALLDKVESILNNSDIYPDDKTFELRTLLGHDY